MAYITELCLIVGRPCKSTTFDKKTQGQPTLRKIKRGVLLTHKLTQKHHI